MLKTYIPKSDQLRKYVDFFYTFDKKNPCHVSYISFPHVNTGIAFFKNTSITRLDNKVSMQPLDIKAGALNTYSIEIVGKVTEPLFIQYQGNVQELSIIFKPLGINHFLKENFSSIAPNFSQEYINAEWLVFAPLLFKEESEESQISLLESFLLKKIQTHDLTSMYKAIEYLEDVANELSIQEIASILRMNLKTFQRRFYKHLACTPSDYRRIFKFRASLNSGLLSKDLRNLTTLTYESNYYDQSYFVREYRKLTRLNPKAFFNKISVLNDQKIIWEVK